MDEIPEPNEFANLPDEALIKALTEMLSSGTTTAELTVQFFPAPAHSDTSAAELHLDGRLVRPPEGVLKCIQELRSFVEREQPGCDSVIYRVGTGQSGAPEVEVEISRCEGGGGE